ncbi:MAG: hypothetical protein ABII20_00450 [Candidatus Omnitrophota bacterium]|nr:hypothetical protein [Candidatus Omnitrophota bacterium]MBU2529176.1 hypothetical protein [bacterium]MBU3930450.1 hypothetical protein [bacterium]MBU4123621.1 hypothetical protein [bacterium]
MGNKKLKFVVAGAAFALFVSLAWALSISLTNQNFNNGTLTGWSANSTSITASSDYSNDGGYSCKFKDPTTAFSGRTLNSDTINLVTATGSLSPSDDYAFSLSAHFYVASEAAAGEIEHTDIQLYVKWYDASGNDLGKDTGLISGTNLSTFDGWHSVSSPGMAAPANAVRAKVYIAVKETVNNNNDVYVDTVRFSYDPLPAYLKTIGLKTFNPDSGDVLKVFFPYSTPAGKPSSCRIVFNLPSAPVTEQRVNVLVYDAKGRLVRAIVKGEEFLAQHYDYIWDGRDVNQQFLPCGMYIISVEVADQDTGGVVKEQTVVAIGRKL